MRVARLSTLYFPFLGVRGGKQQREASSCYCAISVNRSQRGSTVSFTRFVEPSVEMATASRPVASGHSNRLVSRQSGGSRTRRGTISHSTRESDQGMVLVGVPYVLQKLWLLVQPEVASRMRSLFA